ncbi:MAG: hypothetical protein U0S50_00795 [Sphingopyxis sp.]|uniref:hypothetical protein n=1 Tax=Sphingopyxis sp. TaxID=1908224 RepID=UPI002AB8368B|nr:hypothetical protein [Sphingopyxis sp.]MDZ3830336.1 hypothetical protein [Sphingopyxis sp.]
MDWERRKALALAAGIALSAGMSKDASACSRRLPPAFRPTKAEQRRMLGQLKLLKDFWNRGQPGRFIEQYCIEHAQLNYILDGRGGNWADAVTALRIFHARYPRITSDFSGVMFDPLLPFLYAFAEFEEAPKAPSEDEEITLCFRAGMVPAFIIQMRFVESYYPKASRIPADKPIVAQLSFREHRTLAGWFSSNA